MSETSPAVEPVAVAKITARDAIRAIIRERWRQHFCLHNYTPQGWWECDIFELTKSGYFREYEVKLTRGDFLRDAKKATERWVPVDVPGKGRIFDRQVGDTKHELLAAGSVKGPTRFWFVVPEGLVKLEEVPTWAGLIEVTDSGDESSAYWRYRAGTVKEAPQLHKTKCDSQIGIHARGICYYRMHDLLLKASGA